MECRKAISVQQSAVSQLKADGGMLTSKKHERSYGKE